MNKKKTKLSSQGQEYDAYVDYISIKVDELSKKFCKRHGLENIYKYLYSKLKDMDKDILEHLAIAEDCLKNREAWQVYIKKAKRITNQ